MTCWDLNIKRSAPDIRFSLAEYDEQTQDDIIALLRPFVGQNIDMQQEKYIACLKEIIRNDAKAGSIESESRFRQFYNLFSFAHFARQER